MKKIFSVLISAGVLITFQAKAQTASYIEEVQALGYVAGQGLACGASKLDKFEMLARAIIITKAASNKNQADGMYAYNTAKADSYFSKQMDGLYGCTDIVRRFDRQDIFKITLYGDGSIKMPDDTVITPRQPYDASILTITDDKAREKAQEVYDKGDNVIVGEITINTDGSSGPIKTTVPTKVKVNHPKPTTPTAPVQPRTTTTTQSSAAASANKTIDSSGVRHISR